MRDNESGLRTRSEEGACSRGTGDVVTVLRGGKLIGELRRVRNIVLKLKMGRGRHRMLTEKTND